MCVESCVPDKVAKVGHPMAEAELVIGAGMEASSLNAFLMAEKLGWAMYPIGRSMGLDCAGSGAVMGLVLIG